MGLPSTTTRVQDGSTTTIWDAFNLTLNLYWRGSKNEEGACGAFMATVKVLGPNFEVGRIDSRVITALIEGWKRDGQAGGTVNRKLAALSKVCKTAHAAGMLGTPPPVFPRLREAPHRTRVVTDGEFEALVNRSGTVFGKLWTVLLDTGMRVSEALSLEWADVDFADYAIDAARIVVRESKSGSPRTVPMTVRAREALLWTRARRFSVPFPVFQGDVNREWAAVRDNMRLAHDEQFVPHALRHTCATRLVSRGVPLAVVQRWLGHKTIAITMRYAHVGDGEVFKAARTLEPQGMFVRCGHPSGSVS